MYSTIKLDEGVNQQESDEKYLQVKLELIERNIITLSCGRLGVVGGGGIFFLYFRILSDNGEISVLLMESSA